MCDEMTENTAQLTVVGPSTIPWDCSRHAEYEKGHNSHTSVDYDCIQIGKLMNIGIMVYGID